MENNKIEQWISRDTHIKQDMINRMVDLFDEATMKHYYGFIDEERENTDVTNYNNEKATTNYYENCTFRIRKNGKSYRKNSFRKRS